MAQGGTYEGAADLATASTSLVVDRIQRFDLRVYANKTEALFFRSPRMMAPPRDTYTVDQGEVVRVGAQMKYLGLLKSVKG